MAFWRKANEDAIKHFQNITYPIYNEAINNYFCEEVFALSAIRKWTCIISSSLKVILTIKAIIVPCFSCVDSQRRFGCKLQLFMYRNDLYILFLGRCVKSKFNGCGWGLKCAREERVWSIMNLCSLYARITRYESTATAIPVETTHTQRETETNNIPKLMCRNRTRILN